MAPVDSQQRLLPSLLDRLIDDDPKVSTEPEWKQSQTLAEYKQSLCRDLEALLNTRRTLVDIPDELPHISHSMLTVGLPDFANFSPDSADDRERFRLAVQRCIEVFEPRIRQVRVTMRDRIDASDRALHLIIEGLLWIEPNPEPVTFDTEIHAGTNKYEVRPR